MKKDHGMMVNIGKNPLELIKNDKLLTSQKIKPILKRIIKTLIVLLSFNVYLYWNYIG